MHLDNLPLWLFFVLPLFLVFFSVEMGFRIGKFVQSKTGKEKESPVSTITGTSLTLLGFILAFTFSLVSTRYQTRFQLVHEEANIIGTAWLRTDFLPEPQRQETRKLFLEYTDLRILASTAPTKTERINALKKAAVIQENLWEIAAGAMNQNPNIATSQYIYALNELIDIQMTRIATSLQSWIPAGIWIVLVLLMIFGVSSLGFQIAISGAARTWSVFMLAITLSLTIFLIVALDRPVTSFIKVSQKPLILQRESMK